jgi:hypothetical protein
MVNVCFCANNGLKSDIAPSPKSAKLGHAECDPQKQKVRPKLQLGPFFQPERPATLKLKPGLSRFEEECHAALRLRTVTLGSFASTFVQDATRRPNLVLADFSLGCQDA